MVTYVMNSSLVITAPCPPAQIKSLERPRSSSRSRNSFIALLLRTQLHKVGALAPVNCLDGITYRRIPSKTRKSFIALLLPLLFPISPLLHYSYKKMGGYAP